VRTAGLLSLFCASLCTATLAAQQPRLIKDINLRQVGIGSSPGGFASIGNVTYFFAQEAGTGNELWKTDGTEAGTTLVLDIRPGPTSGIPDYAGTPAVGNRILFIADDGEHGREVWASDGTAGGTRMLADIAPGTATSNAQFGTVVGSTAYFIATAPASGIELWRTDGTPGGTGIVKDLNPGPGTSVPKGIGAIGSTFFFRGYDGVKPSLFATDGTEQGTHMIDPRPAFSGAALGATLLFTLPGAGTWDLMRTDGASEAIVVRPAFVGSPPESLAVAGGVAYFVANDGISGSEIWRSDGTVGGTRIVADLAPGPGGLSLFGGITVMGDRIWFSTSGADAKLWISDGTAAGTRVMKDVPNGVAGRVSSGSRFYFAWNDGTHGNELWTSDGTQEGTTLLEIAAGPESALFNSVIVPRPDGVFFTATNNVDGLEPWISDGTAAGTRMVKNIGRDTPEGSSPGGLANLGGKLFFSAYDGFSSSIWTSNGATATPLVVPDLYVNGQGVASGALYYFVAGDLPRLELWRTDGTVAGTIRLFAMNESRVFATLLPFKGGLFFQGSDDEHGAEPWFTDGTVAGTRPIADVRPGNSGSYLYNDGTAVAGDWVYFPATATGGPAEPWRTDGTAAGTQRIAPAGLHDAESPRAFTRVGNDVYFASALHDAAFNLWRTNIATGESVLVRRFDEGAPYAMWNVAGTLLFTLRDQLWRSDGTEAGTTIVRDDVAVPRCFHRGDFAVGNGLLFWLAFHDSVPELWRSDGTPAGTIRLGAFEGSSFNSLHECVPQALHFNAGRLYFAGSDPIHGAEPWISDGTIAGTNPLYDIVPGPTSSDAGGFFTLGNTLFFIANEPATGPELWSACLTDCRRRAVRK
jgi:ELWxxDGT repeat protein